MILQSLLFTKLGAPFETPSGGAWDDQITYNFTTDPEYTDNGYVKHYTDLWSPAWQHMDNLDHIRPSMGVPSWDAPSQWNLPGRAFPGPAADKL
ncbi:hypothetical protein GUITHDRAFT_150806, partial [Guillardia theta CCMP2712]